MKTSYTKKVLSLILSIIMLISAVPMGALSAFAASGETIKGAAETVYVKNGTSSFVRETNINHDWKFNMTTADCSAATYNDSAWSDISLPHDFSIYQNFTTAGEAESGFLPGGTGWYRKKLVIPAEQNGKRFELNFDGAYMHTYVYVNGSYVGENHYGYNSFAFDITDKLTCDGSTENSIAVKVVHNTPSSRWYSGSGIYRNVTLITTDKVHIAHNGLTITTPNISSGNGTVNAVAKVKNDGSSAASVSVKASIYEKDSDSVIATATGNATVNAGATSDVTITPVVSNPQLWSLDNPNLYTAKIEVSVGGNVVDTYEDTFGFRYFGWSRTNGFSLNGTRVQLQGVCMHHDQGALGSAAYYDAMYRQMQNMKNMGVNAIRATHNPYSEDFYKICDELGLLVIEELFDGWAWAKNGNSNDFSSQWNVNLTSGNTIIGGSTSMTWPEFVTKEVCQRDVNRPSVFMWSICNELFEGANGGVSTAETYAQNIINWIKSVDTTRKYTAGDNNIKNGNSYYIAVDRVIANNGGIVGLNYCDSSQYSSIYNNYSSWIFYGAETASTTNTRAMYKSLTGNTAADGNRHITSYDVSSVGWGKTANDSMYTTLSNTFLAGEFRWTGWDYIGEPTPWNGTGTGQVTGGNGATPNSSYFGIVDTAGFEKDTYYLYRSQWNRNANAITTHLVTAWDSDNYYVSNGKTPVFIYSNAAKVELYLRKNGSSTDTLMGTATRKDSQTSVGAKYHQYNTTSNNSSECTATALTNSGTSLYARFDLTYTDGTLFTKSYDSNGNLISNDKIEGRTSVSTAGNVSKAKITADKTEIAADGSSLAYFTVDLLDSNNNPVTTGQNQIKFDITGNGEIMGVDNGDQATTQKYQQSSVIDINNRTTAKIYAWGGKALVVVRSTREAGDFTVTASSPSSEFASVSSTVSTQAVNEGTPLVDGDISSYTYIRNYTVKKGTAPTFDTSATATVVGSDQTVNGTITWNSVSADKYDNAGDYTVKGTLRFTNPNVSFPVSCTLHVVEGLAAVQNISLQTIKGVAPSLPDIVNGLSSTGEVTGQFDVTWDDVNASQFATVGKIVTVNGTASYFGTDTYPVTAYVRVVEPIVSTNSEVTNTAYITSDVASTGLSALKDDNITTKAWTNESNRTNSDKAYIQYYWDTVVSLSSIDIAYNLVAPAAQPEDVDIQYSTNSTDFESIGYTGPVEITANKLLRYQLDETINPIAIRIVFTQQKRTTGEYCVAVNEVKLNSETKSLPEANDSANLSSIFVNDIAINSFSPSKLKYTDVVLEESDIVTATANDNVAITVLPQYDNKVSIVTLSENGENSKIYTVGKVVVPVSNIATNSTVTGSHSMSTSYNVLKDGRTGYDGNQSSYSENGISGLNNLNSWGWRSTNTAPFDVNFEFDKTYDVSQIKAYFWCDSGGTKAPSKFEIQASTDGTSFKTVNTFTERSSNATPENNKLPPLSNLMKVTPCTFDVDIKGAKAIKVIAYQTGTDAVGYAEVEIMGSEYIDPSASEIVEEVKYTFSGADTTYTKNGTAQQYNFKDNTNNTYIAGCNWGTTASHNSDGYIALDNGTITSVESSSMVTSGNAITGVDGKNWSVSMKYQYNYTSDNDYLTLFGIGSHNSVSTQSGGQNNDASYMTNGRYGCDLIQVYKDGRIYINGASTSESVSGTLLSDSVKTITFEYDNGTINVLIDGASAYSKKIDDSLIEKFEAGPGNFFIATSAANLAGGTWHYIGRTNTGYAIHSFKLYEIKAIKTTIEEVAPVDPEEPEEPEETEEFVADTRAIDSAMRAFETKVASGKIYKNIYNAYSAYVDCQKARDAAKYGYDSSIDLAAKAQALTTATNAMTEWTMSMPTDVSKVSARFSSYDNATNNKQYFKSALYITQSDDPVVANSNPGHAWFGIYYHNGTYIYDGSNAIEVPVMLMTIPYKNPFYFFSAYLTGQNSAVSLKGRWFGSDGPGNGQARKYYYYHDEASLQSNSSDYYSRRFSFPSTSSYNNNSTYNDSKIGDLSGKSNWNLATTNTFIINGATLFPSGSKTVSTDVSFGTINMHTYNSTSLSSPWKNAYTLGTQVKVINQKGLKDRVTTYTDKFKNVANYKEGGLNWAADGINRFAGLDYSITSQSASTLTGDMTTAHNSFNSADSSTPVDSTAYAALRTALDNAQAITGANCFAKDKLEAYNNARANAIAAMKVVATNGYVGTNISSLATALNNAKTAMENTGLVHKYSAGVYNSANKTITYTCANGDDTVEVDATAYVAALEELNYTLAQTKKLKAQAVKNCLAELESNDYNNLISGTSVSKVINQTELDAVASAVQTLNTEMNKRINLKRFDVYYTYQRNEETLAHGLVVDSRYGDWLGDSKYNLGENEQVYRWTVTSNGVTESTVNKNTNMDILVTKDMELACYITDGSDVAPENQCKVTLLSKNGRIAGMTFVNKDSSFTVDGDTIKDGSGNVVFKANKVPFYQIKGFKIGSTSYISGDSFTITKDQIIVPVYEAESQFKIYTVGDATGVKINGEFHHTLSAAYGANWDEQIQLEVDKAGAAVYWYINGRLAGYGTSFAFRATQNAEITISIAAPSNNDPNAFVSYFKYDVELNKVTAVVDFYTANQDATSAGVVLSTATSDKDEIIAKGKKFNSTSFTSNKNQVRISVSRTATTSFTMYAVPFVVVNGTTYYGNVETLNY